MPEQQTKTEAEQRQRELRRALGRLIVYWRNEASGHYCQTYNQGLGEGLRQAANALEKTLVEYHEAAQ